MTRAGRSDPRRRRLQSEAEGDGAAGEKPAWAGARDVPAHRAFRMRRAPAAAAPGRAQTAPAGHAANQRALLAACRGSHLVRSLILGEDVMDQRLAQQTRVVHAGLGASEWSLDHL